MIFGPERIAEGDARLEFSKAENLARRTIEAELLLARYPEFTSEVRDTIRQAYDAAKSASQNDELMIDAIWNQHEDEFYDIALRVSTEAGDFADTFPIKKTVCRAAILSYINEAQLEVERLVSLSDDELLLENENNYRKRQAASPSSRILSLEAYAFFNMPEAQARYEHWLRLEYWTCEEAAALLLGKDPSVVNPSRLESDLPHKSPIASTYRDVLDRLSRLVLSQRRNVTKPADFIRLAKKADLPVPEELERLAPGRGAKGEATRTARLNKTYIVLSALLAKTFDFNIESHDVLEIDRVLRLLDEELRKLNCSMDRRTLESIICESKDVALAREPKMVATLHRGRALALRSKQAL